MGDLLERVRSVRFALSIRQPWAWLIVHGHKDTENRDWPTKLTGDVLIHAGKAWGPDERDTLDDLRAGINPADYKDLAYPLEDLPEHPELGGFVGIARIVGCVAGSDSRWFVGAFGFMLRDAAPLPFVPSRGHFGFYRVDEADRQSLLRILEAA
jgi:hypothetical protein